MGYPKEQRSCLECIWYDQCGNDEICSMFDPGELLTDEEIKIEIEIRRRQYGAEYQKYIEQYGDGRNDQ